MRLLGQPMEKGVGVEARYKMIPHVYHLQKQLKYLQNMYLMSLYTNTQYTQY